MIYNTNLDFRMQHILAPFNVSGNTSKAECLNIANFLQVAFYMKYCSQMIEKIEPPEMLCKSRVRKEIGYYLNKTDRWCCYATRHTNYEYYKDSVKALLLELEEDLPIEARVNFTSVYRGYYNKLKYKPQKDFRDAFIAMDRLNTEIDTLDDVIKDAKIFKFLVVNELERLCGRKYIHAENILQIYEEYELSNDLSVVNDVEFLDGSAATTESKSSLLLKSMGWTLI